MKILLISDIHGNFPALQAVAKHAHAESCGLIINTGDSMVYASFCNQTLDWLRSHKVLSILGNTDIKVKKLLKGKNFKKPSKPDKRIMYTTTAESLSQKNRLHLLKLKKKAFVTVKGYRLGLFHGSPEDPDEFLFACTPKARFQELARATDYDIIITGHSHTPYHKFINGVHFINPGSTGRMFDGNPQASYAILHLKKNTIRVNHYRCSYAIEEVVRKLAEKKLPEIYAEMYRRGKKLN
ncbi:MAG: metallophosphoesterase [Deltaproteobacteria bacterium]|nr:MAG: metallophosphoesterase [Deltaproteobacteria bacterium]